MSTPTDSPSQDNELPDAGAVPIREVSERTGVNSVTLRAWERRYGLLKPLRTAKGHRLYRTEDIERVVAIQGWLARGVAVGQVRALLDNAAEQDQPAAIEPADHWAGQVDGLKRTLISLNTRALQKQLSELTAEYPIELVADRVLEPLLTELRTQSNVTRPEYGVRARRLCLESVLMDYFASARHRHVVPGQAPHLLLVDNGRNADAVLPMILAYSLGVHRLRVDFFGSVPASDWLYTVQQLGAQAVVLYADGAPLPGLEVAWEELERQLGVPVWLAGRQTILLGETHSTHCLGQSHLEIIPALKTRLRRLTARDASEPSNQRAEGPASPDSGVGK